MRASTARRPWGLAIITALVVVPTLWWLLTAEASREPVQGGAPPPRPVSVVTVSPGDYTARITGLGEVRPRWSSTLTAEVGGRLTSVSNRLLPGHRVGKGEILARVDPTPWAANLAEARNRVATAHLELLRARQEALEARRSWEESGLTGAPTSNLVLHEPQVAAAEAEVAAAEAAAAWASTRLERTTVRSPFDGVVVEASVNPGEAVAEGQPVVTLFSTEAFDVALPLSESQWRQLPEVWVGATATLHGSDGMALARATILRGGGAIDPATRLRTLHLEVAESLRPDDPVLPGAFVQIRVDGRPLSDLLRLPEGVLTRRGTIWYVDADDALRNYATEPVFTSPGHIYVRPPHPGAEPWRVVRYPLDSFIAGTRVRPTPETDGG